MPPRARSAPPRRPAKAPRRTAERILDAALALFNRFGEPNVSTTAISAEVGISPGNLHYHFPAKNGLIDTLFDRYDASLTELLGAAEGVENVEDAWFFFHSLFELIWEYRFLYRDLNDLLSNNRKLEIAFQRLLQLKTEAVQQVLRGVSKGGDATLDACDVTPVATAMVVVLTYWLSFEYVRDPRRALEPDSAGAALMRGAFHVLSLLSPYLDASGRAHLVRLAGPYLPT